eukprot:250502_1
MEPLFQQIEHALAQYYADCGRNDYFDENGMGKFMRFVKQHEFDENAIDLELGEDVPSHECLFIEMDPMFPLILSQDNGMSNESRHNEILKILKHCYKHGAPPPPPPPVNAIHRLLELPPRDSDESALTFVLNWQHIANALSHELYDKISSSFMVIVNGDTRFENVNELLEEIQDRTHIQQDEMNYIRQLIQRAKLFHENNEIPSKGQVHGCMLHMNDILAPIYKSDDGTMQKRVIQYINDAEYDTDNAIDDLNCAVEDANQAISQSPQPLAFKHIQDMKNVQSIDLEVVQKLANNKQFQDTDLEGKEVCIASRAYPQLLSVRGLIELIRSAEWVQNAHKYMIYDLDGVFSDDDSLTIRERYYDEWQKNTKRIINDIWTADQRSNLLYLDSDLLQIKLHSNENIDPKDDGLSFSLRTVLYDIYNVHKCFLFDNCHFEHYKASQFTTDVCNNALDPQMKQFAELHEHDITTINLYPSYIIDDDMYTICNYFFCASRIVHNAR